MQPPTALIAINFDVGLSPHCRASPINPRHGHHVADGEGVELFEKLAPVAVRTGHLLT
jgi:hypothetical protein